MMKRLYHISLLWLNAWSRGDTNEVLVSERRHMTTDTVQVSDNSAETKLASGVFLPKKVPLEKFGNERGWICDRHINR